MKKTFIFLLSIMVFTEIAHARALTPHTLGAVSDLSLSESSALVKEKLEANGFQVLGEYAPAWDKERWLIVITSKELLNAAGKLKKVMHRFHNTKELGEFSIYQGAIDKIESSMIIDISKPKHTAFLPYEFLVTSFIHLIVKKSV